VGTRTDAALAQVLAARADLEEEVDRLEAAGRAAVDIPARVRQNPARAAGVAAGGAFVALGGPKRLLRRAKRAVTGKDEDLPSELLPKEVERTLRKLGTDGRAVRGTLEREFAHYLDDRAKARKKEGVVAAATAIALAAFRPIAIRGGRQLAERMLNPNAPSFQEQLERIRERRKPGGEAGSPHDAGL
jgi:hypothetical protein